MQEVKQNSTGDRVSRFRRTPEDELDQNMGRQIGYDFFCYGMQLPEDAERAIVDGYKEAKHTGNRPVAGPSIWDRRTVRLKYSAWKRSRVVDIDVTPEYLESIQVKYCPITHVEMTRGTGGPTDATIDRVFNHGAYARGNLAMMSMAANRAKANLMPLELFEIARRNEDADGLKAIEWNRLAALTAIATPPDYHRIVMPMLVWPPKGVFITNGYMVIMQGLSMSICGYVTNGPKTFAEMRDKCKGKATKRLMDECYMALMGEANRLGPWGMPQMEVIVKLPKLWESPLVWTAFTKLMKALGPSGVRDILAVQMRVLSECINATFTQEMMDKWQVETKGYAR